MRLKIIKSFFAATLALCIIYSSIRSAYHYVLASTTTYVSEETVVSEEIIQSNTLETEEALTENTEETEEALTESTEETEETLDESPAEDKPTLSEYLSTLTCGGCGRNCSLLHPRCHNGNQKASRAESAYYETYGE
ncbi:hypothetical protein [Anaeromicropila populeti]|uniref:Uncharacterized protein n=1 Tax=Anaeromicropila populeti TaxID=37658 RepID=A0A1I6LJ34_9FIRM|nr:hypothetical protein [Anaeromicropila populeti]SFS03393.1 hypothetical protein SAMN05661086_03311 [Anaeromicropila populeti]